MLNEFHSLLLAWKQLISLKRGKNSAYGTQNYYGRLFSIPQYRDLSQNDLILRILENRINFFKGDEEGKITIDLLSQNPEAEKSKLKKTESGKQELSLKPELSWSIPSYHFEMKPQNPPKMLSELSLQPRKRRVREEEQDVSKADLEESGESDLDTPDTSDEEFLPPPFKTPSKQIGRAVQQECRDRSRMPSSA
eukprot:TRINITY_DN8046_c0_g1_i9.p1 TRINITY_DN8046_c0_g1~~TRINITY_DN8046_c0_g1_i9.p1  ORF type:complete len:194 (-),score=25.71 TRINITY_DN8046_c0_g1_i9:21-602(-)